MTKPNLSDKEYDQLAATVWDECARIYDREYKVRNNLPLFEPPWTTCTTCGENHHCVVDIGKFSAECCACRFKRRMAEEEQKLIDSKLAYRKEQLKDFAKI